MILPFLFFPLFRFQILKYSNILTKMASFKILLVVALVAFIGSTGKKHHHIQYFFPKIMYFLIVLDALKCMDTVGRSSAAKSVDCADGETSCFITAKISKYLYL